jgi:deazaflavin-dependent oxidoreductase (nitroreductase family)
MKTVGVTHNAVYRTSGGRVGGKIQGMPVLLLTTTGRKSGKSRTTPLLFVRDGDTVVIVASNGGSDSFPSWWFNLQSEPAAEIEIGPEHTRVTAREASPEERARLWPEFTSRYQGYAKYATRTERVIPVVILAPVSPAAHRGDL